jgi:hypothetical protein
MSQARSYYARVPGMMPRESMHRQGLRSRLPSSSMMSEIDVGAERGNSYMFTAQCGTQSCSERANKKLEAGGDMKKIRRHCCCETHITKRSTKKYSRRRRLSFSHLSTPLSHTQTRHPQPSVVIVRQPNCRHTGRKNKRVSGLRRNISGDQGVRTFGTLDLGLRLGFPNIFHLDSF